MHRYLERARDGDQSARQAVVDSLHPRIKSMACHYARCSGEDPDDLLQEAWLGLLEALPELDLQIGSPEQYLISRARWRLLDAIKRARVRRCAPLDESTADQTCAPVSDSAMAVVCVSEFARGLESRQRAVFDCLLSGLTWREAGHVLGCTSANIAYYVRRIRRRYEEWNGGCAASGQDAVPTAYPEDV